MNNPPTPFGYAIFCDDHREEKSGKEIFVGVYSQTLIIAELPAFLPSFYAIVVYCEVAGESDEPVICRIELPSDASKPMVAEQPISVEKIRTPKNIEAGKLLTVRSIFNFSPLPLIKEGDILIHVKRGALEFEVGHLTVQLKPTSEH
jgi:hypothetical protein